MKSIEINYLTSSGYETLYPQTSSDLVAYNSQTLTQVINQQNSEIAGLQGQVGDSEVGVTIPKVVEYHFGGANLNSNVTAPIFSTASSFPMGILYMEFIFYDLLAQGTSLSSALYLNYSGGKGVVIIQYAGTNGVGFDKFVSRMFARTSPDIGANSILLIPASTSNSTLLGAIHCTVQDGIYYSERALHLEVMSGTLSYSSLDIRIYYYD